MAAKADDNAKVMAAKADDNAKVMDAKADDNAKVMDANADEDENVIAANSKKDAETKAAEGDQDAKIVNDPVYGTIHLDLLAVQIIDTRYFQRLRYIKQLAFADFVYPGATHTRFSHSIGVYHLARQMIKEIEAHKLPKGAAQLSPSDKRCIRVAALCHDLGHGPFSHLYEQIYDSIRDQDQDQDQNTKPKLEHEMISQFLVEKLFEEYELKKYLGPEPDDQIKLIKDLIKRDRDLTKSEEMKKYMFQIVSNKESGVDVDKWDYFNRDAIACGVPERFQYDRALSVARVVQSPSGTFELGYRDYDAFNMYNMFNTRFTLYRKVYKHKVVQAVDLMVTEVCRLVQKQKSEDQSTNIDLYPITKQHSKSFMKLNNGYYLDVDTFLKLRDDVLQKIGDSSERYKEASALLQRLHERKLYKLFHHQCVKPPPCECAKKAAEKNPQSDCEKEEAEEASQCDCAKKAAEKIKSDIEKSVEKEKRDLVKLVKVVLVTFNYGSKQKNPVGELLFYSKENYEMGYKHRKDEVSLVLPNVFQEYHVRVYETFSGNKKYKKEEKEYRQTLEKIVKKCECSSKEQKDDCK